ALERVGRVKQNVGEPRRIYTDRYPEVIRARAELADAERQLSERAVATSVVAKPAAAPAPPSVDPRTRLLQAISDAGAELKALKNEETSFRNAIASYEQRVENVPRRQEEF